MSESPSSPVTPIIAVEHVFKSVTDSTGTLDILRDIDFRLAPRETAAIVGASGSGKSTLLSIIAGLDTPTRGTVRLDGHDLFALDEDDRAALRAQKVGFVFQSFQLMGNLTALENVMLPLELAERRDARRPSHRETTGHRTANRVVDGRAQHGRSRRFVGTRLHMHTQLVHIGFGLHHDVEQVRDRCALVAAHIAHARLQQPLGDGQNAFAMKDLARAHAQGLDFFVK
eukprot:gene23492-29712_t